MAARSAALKLDWTKVTASLGLRGQTVASLQAFKARNENARRKVQALSELPTTVDFAHYRSVLKNRAVVDEIEKRFSAFQPTKYDVSRQLKAIEAFEVEAVKNAEATKEKVDLELKDLEATLKNIETARPFEELTVVCYVTRRSCRGGTLNRREDGEVGVQGPLVRSGIQGEIRRPFRTIDSIVRVITKTFALLPFCTLAL
ncbi:hypothetical protein F4818DRAFT_249727 [Hypoxylon cercidicola]|nr:hypothetical protein F4818DRAFT_249727 [Hypoxylon cercidicola]